MEFMLTFCDDRRLYLPFQSIFTNPTTLIIMSNIEIWSSSIGYQFAFGDRQIQSCEIADYRQNNILRNYYGGAYKGKSSEVLSFLGFIIRVSFGLVWYCIFNYESKHDQGMENT